MAQFARFALTLMVGVLTRPNNSAPLTVALLSASLYSLILGWLSFGPLPRRETRSPLEKANFSAPLTPVHEPKPCRPERLRS